MSAPISSRKWASMLTTRRWTGARSCSVVRRWTPPDKGGWSIFNTFWSGLDQSNPVVHAFLRGNGKAGIMGWPTAPKIEALRTEWIDAPD